MKFIKIFILVFFILIMTTPVLGFSRFNDVLIRGWLNVTNETAKFININVSANLTATEVTVTKLLLGYRNLTDLPTCTGDDKYTFDGTDFTCATDQTGSGFTAGGSINATNINISGRFQTNLTDCDTFDSDANGVVSCGDDAGAGADTRNRANGTFLFNFTEGAISQIHFNETKGNIEFGNIADQFNEVNNDTPAWHTLYSSVGYKLTNFTSNFGDRLGELWNFVDNESAILDNDTILRTNNITIIRESLWDFVNNDSLVLDNGTILRTSNISRILINATLWNKTGDNIYPSEFKGNVGINTTRPGHKLTVIGDVLFNISGTDHFEIHADDLTDDAVFIELENPTVSGISVIHAELDIGSIPDTRFITLDYDANTLGAEEFATAMSMTFDISDTTGGSIDAILVGLIGEGDNTADVHALSVEPGVKVIFQESGTPLNADVYILNTTAGSFNITANATSSTSNIVMFETNGDTLMIGHSTTYSDIIFQLNGTASNPGIKPVVEHSISGGGWKPLNLSDGTRGMRDSGIMRYELRDVEDDWAASLENNQTKFWIKIERTQGGGGLTAPVEKLIDIVTTTVFEWDDLANVKINDLKLLGNINFTGDNLSIQGGIAKLTINSDPDATLNRVSLDFDSNVSSATPNLRIHSKIVGAADHFFESLMVTNTVGHLCSKDTTLVDCDTELTGPDFYVLDDMAVLGNTFLGNGSINLTEAGEIYTNGSIFQRGNRVNDSILLDISVPGFEANPSNATIQLTEDQITGLASHYDLTNFTDNYDLRTDRYDFTINLTQDLSNGSGLYLSNNGTGLTFNLSDNDIADVDNSGTNVIQDFTFNRHGIPLTVTSTDLGPHENTYVLANFTSNFGDRLGELWKLGNFTTAIGDRLGEFWKLGNFTTAYDDRADRFDYTNLTATVLNGSGLYRSDNGSELIFNLSQITISDVDNSDTTVVQDLIFDKFGRTTAVTSTDLGPHTNATLINNCTVSESCGSIVYKSIITFVNDTTIPTAADIEGTYAAGLTITAGTVNGDELADTITLDATWAINGEDVNFDSDTLFVDVSANNVEIGGTSPEEKLTLTGNLSVSTVNNTIGNLHFFQFNTSCDGFRSGTAGGIILSCV